MDRELSIAPQCTVQILNKEGQLEQTLKEVEKALQL
jgi:hypothetical protein